MYINKLLYFNCPKWCKQDNEESSPLDVKTIKIGEKTMANKLLAKMKKEKAFLDVLATEHKADEWLSTNCISVNLLLSGKIQGRN